MILNIAIIDDDVAFLSNINEYVFSWSAVAKVDVKISTYNQPIDFLVLFRKQCKWDLIISDVKMPTLDGISLAERIREVNQVIPIIFVSSYTEFSLQGYEVNAIRFLYKHAHNLEAKMHESLNAALDSFRVQTEKRFKVMHNGKHIGLNYNEILYFEQNAHFLLIHTGGGNYSMRMNMKDCARTVPEYFIATSRSYIVNLNKVKYIEEEKIVMINGDTVPLTHSNRSKVLKAFKENLF